MEENLHDIDDLFRKGLGNSEDNPSRQVWDRIADALDDLGKPLPSSRPSGIIPWRMAASLLLIGIAAYLWNRSGDNPATRGPAAGQTLTQKSVSADNRPASEAAASGSRQEVPAGARVAPEVPFDDLRSAKDQPISVTKGEQFSHSGQTRTDEAPSSALGLAALGTATARNSAINPATQDHKVTGSLPRPSKRAAAYISGSLDDAFSADPLPLETVDFYSLRERLSQTDFSLEEKYSRIDLVSLPKLSSPETMSTLALAKPPARPVQSVPVIPRFSLTPAAALSFTTNTLKENASSGPPNRPGRREFRETEQNNVTLSPGLLADFRIAKNLTLMTGFTEFRNSVDIAPKKIDAVRDASGKVLYRVDCSLGSFYLDAKAGLPAPVPGDSMRINNASVSLRYASIPLAVKLYGGNNRFSYFGTAGLEYNFLVNKDVSASLQPGPGEGLKHLKSEGVRNHFVQGLVGAGLDVKLNKRLSLTVMPQYRFALKAASQSGPVETYPNSFTMVSGLRISL